MLEDGRVPGSLSDTDITRESLYPVRRRYPSRTRVFSGGNSGEIKELCARARDIGCIICSPRGWELSLAVVGQTRAVHAPDSLFGEVSAPNVDADGRHMLKNTWTLDLANRYSWFL